jgi:type VI secretion system protein ImpH
MEGVAVSLDPKLLGRLLDDPHVFHFFQAVHLLETLRPERAPVGEFADPQDEVVRFQTALPVAFPPSEIAALEDGAVDEPARMTVNFLGLTGPQGVLPLDYSLYVGNRARAGDYALKDFLSMFEHRMISLFYRAWVKTHAEVSFTGDVRSVDGDDDMNAASRRGGETAQRADWLSGQLLSLVGMSTPGLRGRLPFTDESLLYYAGLLTVPSRPAYALEQLVGDYFDVPCEVEQFVGAWYPLHTSAQTSLGEDVALDSLGFGAVAGDEVWDQQGRVRVRIGPLTRRRYDEFLPGGRSHDALRALTRFFGNDQFDFEIQLVLARDEAPPFRLDGDDVPLPLGWCTWLRTVPLERDPDDALFTL